MMSDNRTILQRLAALAIQAASIQAMDYAENLGGIGEPKDEIVYQLIND